LVNLQKSPLLQPQSTNSSQPIFSRTITYPRLKKSAKCFYYQQQLKNAPKISFDGTAVAI